MTDGPRTSEDVRRLVRRRREARTDYVFAIAFNTRASYVCPDCGAEHTTLIATNDPEAYSPTFGPCSTWDCDAFHKFVHVPPRDEADEAVQADLERFAGGASA